jgi:uncharacterized protein (DUF433 family)
MAAAALDIGQLVSSDPAVLRGRAYIAGTRVSVARIAHHALTEHLTIGQIEHDVFEGTLSPAQIHAALAYYHANRTLIEAEEAAFDVEYDAVAADAAASSLASRKG